MKHTSKTMFGALFVVAICCLQPYAQNVQTIERQLVNDIKELEKWSSYTSNYDGDKLNAANETFMKNLAKFTKNAETLKASFEELSKEMNIETSADGKFRVYSWDTLNGGTMHFYETLYQFKRADGKVDSYVYSSGEEGDPGAYVDDIFEVPTPKGTVYLVCTTARLSNPDRYSAVSAYKIEGNKLNSKVNIFKTSKVTNSIGFPYSAFSAMDQEMEGNLIKYDPAKKILKIPVVLESEMTAGDVTKKTIDYKFNGTYFVKMK